MDVLILDYCLQVKQWGNNNIIVLRSRIVSLQRPREGGWRVKERGAKGNDGIWMQAYWFTLNKEHQYSMLRSTTAHLIKLVILAGSKPSEEVNSFSYFGGLLHRNFMWITFTIGSTGNLAPLPGLSLFNPSVLKYLCSIALFYCFLITALSRVSRVCLTRLIHNKSFN